MELVCHPPVQHDPFIRLNNANGSYYEGFLVDLLSLLKRRLEFSTVLAPQQRYGQQDGAGVWNGEAEHCNQFPD